MSEKELRYVEDSLNQIKLLQIKCDNCGHQFQDRELKAFAKDLEERQRNLFGFIYKVLQ